ncbi:MAG: hypothetical protein PVH87_07675 [Desulfobacteraceae bacterium]|jgi:hypothetical protein
MTTNTKKPFICPFCGERTSKMKQAQIDLLREAGVLDIVSSLIHDFRGPLRNIVGFRELSNWEEAQNLSAEIKKMLAREEQLYNKLYDLLDNAGAVLFWRPEKDSISLKDLAYSLRVYCQVYKLPPVDFTPLLKGGGGVSFTKYRDAFCIAVQGGLLAISRERSPSIDLSFRFVQGQLITTLSLKHTSPIELQPIACQAIEWIVSSAGGSADIRSEETQTTICWTLPATLTEAS